MHSTNPEKETQVQPKSTMKKSETIGEYYDYLELREGKKKTCNKNVT
jgi:hypothetical protein